MFLDVNTYLNHYGVSNRQKNVDNATFYCLDNCIFDESHRNNDSAIIKNSNGSLRYQCFHNSCQGRTWADARLVISGSDSLARFMIGDVDKPTEKKKILDVEFISFGEMCSTEVEEKPIIRGLINEGEMTMIHAPGGVGKSLLTNYLALELGAYDIFNPTNLFDKFEIKQTAPSLFLQAENGIGTMKKRISKMINAAPIFKSAMDRIFSPKINNEILTFGQSFSDPVFQQWILNLVDVVEQANSLKIKILFIDPLISFHSGDENDSVKMRSALDGLSGVCSKSGLTPIVIHHDNRSKNYRGSSAIFDWARNIIGLSAEWIEEEYQAINADTNKETTGTRPIKIIKLHHEKSNNHSMFNDFYIRFDDDFIFYKYDKSEQLDPNVKARCKEVVKTLDLLGGTVKTQKEFIEKHMTNIMVSRSTSQRYIKEAVDYGFVYRDSQGKFSLQEFKINE